MPSDTPTPALTRETLQALARAVRSADQGFEESGGSSRHWVIEQFIPALEAEGLTIATMTERDTLTPTAPEVCPTCGSDKREVRGHRHVNPLIPQDDGLWLFDHEPHRAHKAFDTEVCKHPLHDTPPTSELPEEESCQRTPSTTPSTPAATELPEALREALERAQLIMGEGSPYIAGSRSARENNAKALATIEREVTRLVGENALNCEDCEKHMRSLTAALEESRADLATALAKKEAAEGVVAGCNAHRWSISKHPADTWLVYTAGYQWWNAPLLGKGRTMREAYADAIAYDATREGEN